MIKSFKTRLTIWNVSTLSAAMLLLGGLLIVATHRLTLKTIDNQLLARASSIQQDFLNPRGFPGGNGGQGRGGGGAPGNNSPFISPNGPGLGVRTALDRLRPPPIPNELDEESRRMLLIQRPRVFSREGTPIFESAQNGAWDEAALQRSLTGQPVFSTVKQDALTLRILSFPLMGRDQQIGVIQISSNLAPIAAIQSSQLILLAILVPATLVLAAIGATLLTRRALKPLEELTTATHGIGINNLGQRIPTDGDEEFALLAEEFNGMIARLHQSFTEKEKVLQAQKQFTADASHELRTPLTRIKLITSAAQDDEALDVETKERMQVIQTATDNMTSLVEQMLTLARTENLKDNPNLQPHSLTSVIANAIQIAHLEDDPRLKIELKDKRVLINAAMLERAILNILTNASRHTPPDGQITISTSENNGFVRICVSDTGEGIPDEHLSKITDRFYRVDSARNHSTGGTGLGLSIVDSIVSAHGGSLDIQSKLGIGTSVCFSVKKA